MRRRELITFVGVAAIARPTRVALSEYVVRCQNNIAELLAGECAEMVLHPDLPTLGTRHGFVEAGAFARVAVVTAPATLALLEYCKAEAHALLTANRDILDALVEALIEHGELDGDEIDVIISGCISPQERAMPSGTVGETGRGGQRRRRLRE